MANNFFLNQDPLLFQSSYPRYNDNEEDLRRQLNENMMQYKMLQQQNSSQKDYLGDLDRLTRGISESAKEELMGNDEYKRLNYELTSLIQDELMMNIKWRINGNQSAVKNIERQTELINKANKKVDDEQRKNLNDINDYVKNYSNITFNEYQKMKKEKNNNTGKKKNN